MKNIHSREKTIVILTVLAFIVSFLVAFVNRQDAGLALQNTFTFTALACLIMIVLHIGALIAERKGYPTWLGVALVGLLNVVGFLILLILPDRHATETNASHS